MDGEAAAIECLKKEEARIVALGERLKAMPEPGFREFETASIVAAELAELGAEVQTGLAVSGIKATIGKAGAPAIFLVADLDALPTLGAPDGIAHSCGHNAQVAVMLSVFRALVRSDLHHREGVRLVFIGAPAEEYVDMDYRLGLRAEGRIEFLSGKQELIRLGAFDEATVVLKYHSMPDSPGRSATVNGTLNGFMAKRATFLGLAAHAGASPEKGVNALNAAAIAQLAIHSQRETFRDEDHIRVHPILREGGTAVNTVPDKVVMETYVRGASFDAIRDASAKVDRALAAGAVAVGARVRIEDLPGYQPFRPSPALGEVLGRATLARLPRDQVDFSDASFASDDIGDVASLVPTCQLGFSGFRGTIHGSDFGPSDARKAYVLPAYIVATAVAELAREGGAIARSIREAFVPRFTREEYIKAVRSVFSDRTMSWDPGTGQATYTRSQDH